MMALVRRRRAAFWQEKNNPLGRRGLTINWIDKGRNPWVDCRSTAKDVSILR